MKILDRWRPAQFLFEGSVYFRIDGPPQECNPPEWLVEWSGQVGAELKHCLGENRSWIAFARESGKFNHTYTGSAPDPFVAPYFSFLLERTPRAQPDEPRTWRKDEYPN